MRNRHQKALCIPAWLQTQGSTTRAAFSTDRQALGTLQEFMACLSPPDMVNLQFETQVPEMV